ncbi:MAG: CHAT domain-containing protein [Candidatus Krumholzibacteriia bacterium]
MKRYRLTLARARLAALLWVLPVLLGTPSHAAGRRVAPQQFALLKQIDSLFVASNFDSVLSLIRPELERARALGDSAWTGKLLTARARAEMVLGRGTEAAASFDLSLRLAEAARDTVNWMNALGFKGMLAARLGRWDESSGLNRRRLELARRVGDPVSEAWARTSLAYIALQHAELAAARADYQRAADLFRGAGRRRAELTALIGLGRVLGMTQDVGGARRCYERAWRAAVEIGDRAQEADAVNNLGTLEFEYGDMAVAAQYFERVYDMNRRAGDRRATLIPASNVAIARGYLGQYRDAVGILQDAIRTCREERFDDLLGMLLGGLGDVRIAQGRWHRAAALFRESLSLGESLSKKHRDSARLGLARSLAAMDSAAAAVRVLEGALASSPVPEYEPLIGSFLARCLRKTGRSGDALQRALAVAAAVRRGAGHPAKVQSAYQLSACYRAEGRPREALEWFRRAVALEEEQRQETAAYEWREAMHTRSLVNTAGIVLEYPPERPRAERVRDLFDVFQRLKARTLMERISEPRHRRRLFADLAGLEPMTLAALQRDVLSPGELFLDFVVGDNDAYLFAVTRHAYRLVTLPGARSGLPAKVELYGGLLATPPTGRADAGGPARRSMQEALGELLLGEVGDMIASASRLVISPDAYFSLVPFGTLVLAGGTGAGAPLAIDKEIHYVPSAMVLSLLRSGTLAAAETTAAGRAAPVPGESAPAGGTPAPPHLETNDGAPAARHLALAPNGSSELRGALAEVNFLRRRFAGFEVRAGADRRLLSGADHAHYEILHVAAHVDVNDEKPWRSGILLGAADGAAAAPDVAPTEGALQEGSDALRDAGAARPARPTVIAPDPYLRARDIAASRLPVRLAVLAGCESALGRASSGEGVLGLTSAFISAGVPAVVATLWPVDDAVTGELMKVFYGELARGRTVAAALRRARLTIGGRPRTRHPFYWAGFIVVGDGNVAVRLDEAPAPLWRQYLPAGGLIGLLALAWILLRQKSLRKPSTGV